MSKFIPNFHFVSPDKKLSAEWAMQAVGYYYHNMDNKNLLHGKDVGEIESYASGDIDMTPFKKIYKSIKKALATKRPQVQDNSVDTNVGFEPLPMLPEKLNSAVSVVSKVPIEITCNATDPLAIEKKTKDINFIKNKPLIEARIQDVADRLGMGEVDLGTTENSSVPFSDSPFGLELDNPDELEVFLNLIYSLKIESALETGIQAFVDMLQVHQTKMLEIRDQFKFGVSVHQGMQSPITGLPYLKYHYPGDVEIPGSYLNDCSDRSHTILNLSLTPMELFDYFSGDIKSESHLEEIVNHRSTGYCACNNDDPIHPSQFSTYRMNIKYFEVKSIDYVGVAKSKHKKGYTTLTQEKDKIAEKIWGQNTYTFYWLVGTDHVFKVERLGAAHRERGRESIQNFSINIHRSQKKSAVELSIGENKKAQIADIKLQHAVIQSLPAGRYIDLNFLRNALTGLTDEHNEKTMDDLLHLAMERNIVIGDTEGFDGKNDGQFKPVIDLPGGLKTEVEGYMRIIANANATIARLTGINEQLTGQSANPEGLVGLQKLLINSSINTIHYVNDAMTDQYQKLFSMFGNIIKQCIEEGGEPKKAIVALIGSRKANVIDALDDVRIHEIGIKVKINQREEERNRIDMLVMDMKNKQILSAADEFMVTNIDNPKDKYAFLAVKDQKARREQAEIREQQYAQQQALAQQAGQNQIATKQAEAEGAIKTVYAKGDVQSKILTLASELGMNAAQFKAIVDTNIQRERGKSQADKNIQVLREKATIDQTKSLV